jgi:DNA gyrase subunit A
MMFFTQKGRCFWMKVYNIPEGSRTDKGRAIQNLLNIDSDDKVTAFICIENINDQEWVDSHNLIFCTRQGIVKKTAFVNYSRPRSNGIIAISLNEGDEVVEVLLTSGNDEILIANRNGRAIRFNESTVRNMGRGATGVKAMRLDDDPEDLIVGMIALTKPEGYDEENEENQTDESLYPDMPTILVLSEKGVGKRSTIGEYRITNRNGKGVKTINITEKTGKLVAIKKVMEDEDIMIINKSGVTIRLAVEDIKKSSRNTQGVKLIDIQKRNDVISSVCVVEHTDESELPDNDVSETPETINTQE